MKLLTESINKYLKEVFQKDEFLIADYLLIEYLTVDGKDYEGNKQKVSFKDLQNFKNLKYLEIADVVINDNLIDVLSDLDYLENVVFRNCKFDINNMNKLKNIKSLRIINCKNFDLSYIVKLNNLERLYISDLTFQNLKKLSKLQLESLDISGCSINKILGINELNTNYLVISSNQFDKFKENILDLDIRVMVMADPSYGYYIEKWIN